MEKTFLLTGGTGFLGSHLSIELLKKGCRIIFWGRSKNNENYKQRIKKTLKTIDPSVDLKNVLTIEGDFINDNINATQKINAVWHLAANLSFKEKDREDIFNTNVNGLKNILNITQKLNCPIYYISTAYVHGQRPGKIFENDLIKPKKFNNPYEESKFEAEKTVQEWGKKNNNKFIVFRPSILIKKRLKKVIFFGYYAILYSLYRLNNALKEKKRKIFFPFPYHKKSSLNLMPIDTAIEWMIKISEKETSLNKTFHITNPKPFLIKDIVKQTFCQSNIKLFIFRTPKFFIKVYFWIICGVGLKIKLLKSLTKKFYYYKYYIVENNHYDMTNTKEILGKEEVNKLHFPPDFIKNIAKEFIKKLEEQSNKIL